jgi:hypothetical protein
MDMKFNILFIAGILTVLAGLVMPSLASDMYFMLVLVILGLLIGFVNIIGSEETKGFLLGYLALAITSGVLASIPTIGQPITGFLTSLALLFGPAALVVALKSIIESAGDK